MGRGEFPRGDGGGAESRSILAVVSRSSLMIAEKVKRKKNLRGFSWYQATMTPCSQGPQAAHGAPHYPTH